MKNKTNLLINLLLLMFCITWNSYSSTTKEILLNEWRLIENGKEMTMKVQANIVTPLQIMTDLDVKATVVDNQKLEIPFKLEMNKYDILQSINEDNPNKTYELSYTENLIDIDNDGKIDVEIISPKYSTGKVIENNKIVIYGQGIKEDGIYRKKIYMTVHLKDGI